MIRRWDRPGFLWYVDPPYVLATRGRRWGTETNAYQHEMTDAEHERLAEVLHGARGMVALSGYPSALYDRLYAGWTVVCRRAYTNARAWKTECLWLSPRATTEGQGVLALV